MIDKLSGHLDVPIVTPPFSSEVTFDITIGSNYGREYVRIPEGSTMRTLLGRMLFRQTRITTADGQILFEGLLLELALIYLRTLPSLSGNNESDSPTWPR